MSDYVGRKLLFYQFDKWINFKVVNDLGEKLLMRTNQMKGLFQISKRDWDYQVVVIERLASGRID